MSGEVKIEPATALPAAMQPEPIPLTHHEQAAYRPAGLDECLDRIRTYFDAFAPVREQWRNRNFGYHAELERCYRYYIPSGASVLEVGCGTGDLLAALLPSRGLGIDVSPKMIEIARLRHPHLCFKATAL